VFFWTGDLRSADDHIEQLISCAESHSFGPYSAVGRGFSGELAIRRGDAKSGIESLRKTLDQFHATPYEVQTTPFTASLAQGLAAIGQLSDAIALIDDTIRQCEVNGDHCYMPELLRLKGGFLLAMPQPSGEDAEIHFTRSLEWSRRQGARSLELRTTIDLAQLFADQGRRENARSLLQPVFEEFREGLETADLTAAERLLRSLR
jgi:predicted ATPase